MVAETVAAMVVETEEAMVGEGGDGGNAGEDGGNGGGAKAVGMEEAMIAVG